MIDPEQANITKMWIMRARSDLRLSEVALGTPDIMVEDACFHAQQSVEKALKGLLTHLNIVFPRTHAIELLLDLLKKSGVDIPPLIDEADILTQYAVETRYPGVAEPIERQEAEKALCLAVEVLKWVEGRL